MADAAVCGAVHVSCLGYGGLQPDWTANGAPVCRFPASFPDLRTRATVVTISDIAGTGWQRPAAPAVVLADGGEYGG
jgi:hypothetical protein